MKAVLLRSFLLLLFVPRVTLAQATANPEAWRQDLRFLATEVTRRHANFYSCADAANNPMTSFAAEMFRTADASGVTRFVIDLRNNTGGNSEVIRPVLNGLAQRPWLNQRGRVYVITGNTTISSGLWCALSFQYYANAIVLGEPTGGKPNSYGEALGFLLPNTKIGVQYSTKYQAIVPGNEPTLWPDVPIVTSALDYLNNDDPVWAYLLLQ